MKELTFVIDREDLNPESPALAEAQEAMKALHRYQRKIAGLEITRTRGSSEDRSEAKQVKDESPKADNKPANASDKPAKADNKPANASDKPAKKTPKLTQDDAKEAYVKVLQQFDKVTEVHLAKELGGKILAKHGSSKLSALDPANFGAFIADCMAYDRTDDENEFNIENADSGDDDDDLM